MIVKGDASGYVRTNLEFHRTLYLRAQAPAMLGLIETVWLQAGPTMRMLYERLQRRQASDNHRKIIAALEGGGRAGAAAGDPHGRDAGASDAGELMHAKRCNVPSESIGRESGIETAPQGLTAVSSTYNAGTSHAHRMYTLGARGRKVKALRPAPVTRR